MADEQAAIGYINPDDEQEGRGVAIHRARRVGLMRARQRRIAYPSPSEPADHMSTERTDHG